ncbi:hypothetical protein U1Q18_043867 [Sarracenia purpurea var. burkii]
MTSIAIDRANHMNFPIIPSHGCLHQTGNVTGGHAMVTPAQQTSSPVFSFVPPLISPFRSPSMFFISFYSSLFSSSFSSAWSVARDRARWRRRDDLLLPPLSLFFLSTLPLFSPLLRTLSKLIAASAE